MGVLEDIYIYIYIVNVVKFEFNFRRIHSDNDYLICDTAIVVHMFT